MKVAELAAELGVPPSTVITLCQRFGIDGAWAGAELASADVIVLRAELASDDEPLDLTDPVVSAEASPPEGVAEPPEPVVEPPVVTDAAPETAGALPPTAVGSLAGFNVVADAGEPGAAGGFDFAGRSTQATTATTAGAPRAPQLDRGVRTGLIFFGLALAAVVGAQIFANRWSVPALWVTSVFLLIVAALAANGARRRADLHPDRQRWPWAGKAVLGLAGAGLVLMGSLVWLAVRDEPARDAPLGLGELASVQEARWAYQRTLLLADNGWYPTAKDVGTCWVIDEGARPRTDRRVELGNEKVRCVLRHQIEVLMVFPADRDPDSSFPGRAALTRLGTKRCADIFAEAVRPRKGDPRRGELVVETPTADAWADGDRDIACVAVTPERTAPLLDHD